MFLDYSLGSGNKVACDSLLLTAPEETPSLPPRHRVCSHEKPSALADLEVLPKLLMARHFHLSEAAELY